MAVCVPGHAFELDEITQREALLAVRRQVSRDAQLRACAESLRQHVQSLHGGGPVGRLVQALKQLRWTWPEFGVLRDDWGCKLRRGAMPQGALLHMLRASQRRAFL